ncbi:MAG: XRE family transcriptional regulator [Flavobacteriales bacterium]|nr:MAG: XRE family transcriptional regulator [Flavobacteriales bacterium]
MDFNKELNDQIWEEFSAPSTTDTYFIGKQMDIAAQIDTCLKEKGWTQKHLAELAGLKPSQLSKILSGNANPTLRTITNIEEALECDVIVCPEFYEESLVDNGWFRPGQRISLAANNYRKYTITDEEQIHVGNTWGTPMSINSQQYEKASSASHYKLTV